MKQTARWRGLCAAALLAVAWPAQAYFDHFLNGTIVGTLDKDQATELRTAFGKAMTDADDGASVPFHLDASTSNAKSKATDGTFTPLKTRTENGQRCRKVRSELKQPGRQPERWTGWYCQQPDSTWKKTMIKE
ncbi:hypothetical protein [Cupriavidus sp.]|uniref:hypothetical protein n=1 Tax=Cupriavidus sp. TaxID=1873897 RepID=UPI0025BB44AE|nr:hypothetical protein [Cupriavidus sp.]MCA3187682.1 hypothetical protein [Cupriavidus sp.]MCA3191873.1 hypothetical protein [Cupriavidus sp.]MCA3198104.1 hypothetical protein [Cupriavidus sp.]MCA3200786.1 hypothetical protein [Cupriavidus sp.]MCA3208551.1 hypothetical protein [Cupriavidus sp.]